MSEEQSSGFSRRLSSSLRAAEEENAWWVSQSFHPHGMPAKLKIIRTSGELGGHDPLRTEHMSGLIRSVFIPQVEATGPLRSGHRGLEGTGVLELAVLGSEFSHMEVSLSEPEAVVLVGEENSHHLLREWQVLLLPQLPPWASPSRLWCGWHLLLMKTVPLPFYACPSFRVITAAHWNHPGSY